jgi:hypothetical protein
MGANRIALVSRCQPAVGALGGKNIEMVVPEIDHHFVELALAVHRPQKPRLLELENNKARRVHLARHHAAFLGNFRGRVKLKEFTAAEPHRLQCRDLLFGRVVGNFFRLELFVEIGSDAEPRHFLNVFGRWSKAGPTQEMNDLLILAEWHEVLLASGLLQFVP